jgi:Mg-chelatase subunit ChlD
MGFLHAELLWIAIPVALAWWKLRGVDRGTQIVRALTAALLVLAAAAPYLRTQDAGRDLIVVVDRSRSMPAAADAEALEVIRLAESERREGDRVGVIACGANSALERMPQRDARFSGFERPLDRDGSDLGGALEAALALIQDDRPGSILLLSDGENNGRDPLDVARRAFARGVRVDVRPTARARGDDVLVERIDTPEQVAQGEPFQFSVWVRSGAKCERDFVLERDGAQLTAGHRALEPGLNRLVFRDVLPKAGTAQYRMRLEGGVDSPPENDSARAAVRIGGARSVLIVNHDGARDTLSSALERAGIPIVVRSPESAQLGRIALTSHRAVVLENVAAKRVAEGMGALREFVLERGGGLMITGGMASFGIGGYHRSQLDDLLPVSTEMRQEHRKLGMALAISMDRSGSMAVEVSPGVQKMHLADLGACAAIELLSPIDSVGVIAVDSSEHVIQELTPATETHELTDRVRRISSEGGGIFVYTALLAAGKMLEDAPQKNRHVILFADAADSEEQERCPELVERFVRMGITLSVIALGTESDSDANFLKNIAKLGGGDIYFTTDPAELPRLFAQDTLTISRATFVSDRTACAALPDLFGLGESLSEIASSGFPSLAGYNLTYMRDDASAGVVTTDEYKAPVFAFAYRGLGRAAVYTGQIGGEFGADVVAWSGFASFFVTNTRWLAGEEEPSEIFATARREGREAVIGVEVDPRVPLPADAANMRARLTQADGTTSEVALERVAENRFEARTTLAREGVVLGDVVLGDGRHVALPPLALPYSPEFEVGADLERGDRLLRQIARESGGEIAPPAATLLHGERQARAWRVVTRELVLVALAAMLFEIAARRLQLWGSLAGVFAPLQRAIGARFARRRAARPAVEREEAAPPPAAPAQRAPPPATLDDALERARAAARRELDR